MANAFEKITRYCKQFEELVWFPTRAELAEHMLKTSTHVETYKPLGGTGGLQMPVEFITGGGGLICEGVARRLAVEGWTVVVTDIDFAGAEKGAAGCEGSGRALSMHLGARDPDQVSCVVPKILSDHGRIDGLLNGAGGARGICFPRKSFIEMDRYYWSRMLDAT